MDSINKDEELKQKNFVAKVFLDCYSKFREISVLSEDYLTEFQTLLLNDGQSLLLDLTTVILMDTLIFDEDNRIGLKGSYISDSKPKPIDISKHKSEKTHFINYYLMTNFFESESLKPFNNYTLGFRLIKRMQNENLYYKYYYFVLSELQKLIFVSDAAEIVQIAFVKHKSIKLDFEREVIDIVVRNN